VNEAWAAHNVLIPLDGSDTSANVLHFMGPMCKAAGVSATLLRVVTPTERELLSQEARSSAERGLEVFQRDLVQQGWTVSTRVELGDPAEQILSCARKSEFDLLAMFSHGRTGTAMLTRGSVAERVLRRSEVPVLLCTPHSLPAVSNQRPFRKIVVPLDGSPLADEILPAVQALALSCGSEVTLLRVEVDHYPGPPPADSDWWTPERRETSVAPLNDQFKALKESGVDVKRATVYDQPAHGILGAASDADLVAMTTHGRSGVSRWFFGSVAEAVLREARCPLLVWRSTKA